MINKKRKYSSMKLNGTLGTALHTAVDRWSEQMGCVLCTGGEIDLVVFGYSDIECCRRKILRKIEKKNRNILSKVTRYQQKQASERPTGTSNSG